MPNKKIVCILAVSLFVGCLSGCGCDKKDIDSNGETISFLSVWQGDAETVPEDLINNDVAEKIREETGVTINITTNRTTEVDKLNSVFSTSITYDLISTSIWGGTDSATQILKQAAKKGMLMPLDELVEKYAPNVKPGLTENLTDDFLSYDIEDKEFEGKHYFISDATAIYETDFGEVNSDGLWIRKDIYESLNINRDEIKTSDDIYVLLKQIKENGFKDITGCEVIPGGVMHSGEGLDNYYNTYNCDTKSGYYMNSDGKIEDVLFSPLFEQMVMFVRKLIQEELLDSEGVTQNYAQAANKVANGSYAVVSVGYDELNRITANTLDVTNPEMKYIPLCCIGGPNGRVKERLSAESGTRVLCIPANSQKANSVMKVLNYLRSDEGDRLVRYGIAGKHYEENKDGYPRMTSEWAEKMRSNPKALYDDGVGGIYTRLLGENLMKTRYGLTIENIRETMGDDAWDARQVFDSGWQIKPVKGLNVSYLENGYPGLSTIRSYKTNKANNEVKLRVYFAKTDEEAIACIEEYRGMLEEIGIRDLWKYMDRKAESVDELLF